MDVYSDWVDACDEVAKQDRAEKGGDHAPSKGPTSTGGQNARARSDEDEDDIIDDEDDDGAGAYGGDGIVADDEY